MLRSKMRATNCEKMTIGTLKMVSIWTGWPPIEAEISVKSPNAFNVARVATLRIEK